MSTNSYKIENFTASDQIDLKLFKSSTHYLTGDIDETSVTEAIKWLMYEDLSKARQKTLTLYINTFGGDLYQAFALIDIMKKSRHIIRTIGIGAIMSAGFLIFASGTKGERYLGKNTGIMNHQHSDSMEHKMHDMKAQMIENEYCETRCYKILQEATGLSLNKVKELFGGASDQYLTIEEAIKFKIADKVL